VAVDYGANRVFQSLKIEAFDLIFEVRVRRDAAQLEPGVAPDEVRLLNVGQRERLASSRRIRHDVRPLGGCGRFRRLPDRELRKFGNRWCVRKLRDRQLRLQQIRQPVFQLQRADGIEPGFHERCIEVEGFGLAIERARQFIPNDAGGKRNR